MRKSWGRDRGRRVQRDLIRGNTLMRSKIQIHSDWLGESEAHFQFGGKRRERAEWLRGSTQTTLRIWTIHLPPFPPHSLLLPFSDQQIEAKKEAAAAAQAAKDAADVSVYFLEPTINPTPSNIDLLSPSPSPSTGHCRSKESRCSNRS